MSNWTSETTAQPLALDVRSLILVGGQSSRMGSPKYLLPVPVPNSSQHKTVPLLVQTISAHIRFHEDLDTPTSDEPIYISARNDEQVQHLRTLLRSFKLEKADTIGFVTDTTLSAGPAAGLCAAHQRSPNSHWLITGCDYPFLTEAALTQLYNEHLRAKKAATCFISDDMMEPLTAIWSPTALESLQEYMEAAEGKGVGPMRVLKVLDRQMKPEGHGDMDFKRGVCKVRPSIEKWLTGVNTPSEWERAREELLTGVAAEETEP